MPHSNGHVHLDFKHFETDAEEFEITWVEISSETDPNVIVASIYRHPTTNIDKFLFSLAKRFDF